MLSLLLLASVIAQVHLTCDGSVAPLGVDAAEPRLSWQLTAYGSQAAYEIRVASSRAALLQPDLWDTGRVNSGETVGIAYAGKPLASSQQVFWQVRVWDANGPPSAWSEPAQWTEGLLRPEDWQGAWIASPSLSESALLRRTFQVEAGLTRAILHVSGLGQYELRLNGRKAGDAFLAPGWTDYDRTVLYDTFDVTSRLREGANALGILLGAGMYDVIRRDRYVKFAGFSGPLRAIAHLRLEYANGRVAFVGTDTTWRTHAGPITSGGIYSGEDFDARLWPAGWDSPGFDDRSWPRAVQCLPESGRLAGRSAAADPLAEHEVHEPVSVTHLPDGSWVYDFGQNAAHIPRIRLTGPAGSSVRLSPAELVHPDGTIDPASLGQGPRRGYSWWQYTKATDGPETWEPRFSYCGCRYLHVELQPPDAGGAVPVLESVGAVAVRSAAPQAGRFECSNELLNRIYRLVWWAQASNLVSVFTDCPHRERLGWLEQVHLNGPSIRYDFAADRLFAKCVHDMADAQHADGRIPEIAPEYVPFSPPFDAAAEWGAAFILVPWQQYEFTGDVEILRRNFKAMTRYFAYLDTKAEDGLLSEGLGDWCDLGPLKPGFAQLTPPILTATAFYYEDAATLARIARVLGLPDKAARFAKSAENIRESFNRRFYRPATGDYGAGPMAMDIPNGAGRILHYDFPATSQCADALPLALGIVAPENRGRVLSALEADLERHGMQMTTGDIGFRYLLLALAEGGRSDLIYRIIDQEERPGYGYQLRAGATSLAESWDANRQESQDHFMLGQIVEWFFRSLAGIAPDPGRPGFKHILLAPNPVGDLSWVRASYESARGQIRVDWRREAAGLRYRVTLPANTTATLRLPGRAPEEIGPGTRTFTAPSP